MSNNLNPDKALIFRIVHRDNLPWLLRNGLHCRNAVQQDPNYRTIGHPDLIEKRQHRVIPVEPGGTLADYLPFYFTPYSPMLYNIKSGWGGLQSLPNADIAILVSSLPQLESLGLRYVVSDRHAFLALASFSNDRAGLAALPWTDWQQRHFKRDPEDPDRFDCYQAEALVHGSMPVEALLGVVVYTGEIKRDTEQLVTDQGANLTVHARPGWYF